MRHEYEAIGLDESQCPADPLELTTFPEQVLINGETVPMVSRQTLLRDRYLNNDMTKPPAYRD